MHANHCLAAAIALCAGSTAALAQTWTVINLHPAGATNSECRGISGAQQTGVINNNAAAVVWTSSAATAYKLTPVVPSNASTGISSTVGEFGVGGCIQNGQQGGSVSVLSPSQGVGSFSHASIWNSTPGSWQSLHPSDPTILHTGIYAIDGNTQVGYYEVASGATFGAPSPALWHGTPDSFTSMLPPGYGSGEIRGIKGNMQVGTTDDTGLTQAGMWTGTPDSFISLNPDGAFASAANCTDGTNQYGQVAIATDALTGLFPAMWSSDANSWVQMGPPDRWGEVDGTDGGMQCGLTTDTSQADQRAYVWSGPGIAQDLSLFLPANYDNSGAVGIWRHQPSGSTYVVGYAENTSASNRREAIMWVSSTGVNLIVSPAAPADCSAAIGGALTYTVRVLNAGSLPSGATTLTVNLPPTSTATYSNATPTPDSVTSTQLTFNLASLAALGGSTDISITLTAAGPGDSATITATATTAGEVDPTNNAASASSRIQPAAPGAAPARVIFSTITTSPTSLVPGSATARFTQLNRPIASASGTWWSETNTTNAASAQNLVLVRTQTGNAPTVLAQKGVTSINGHGTLLTCDIGSEPNDSGLVAFAGTDNGTSASSRFIATSDGTTLTEVARRAGAVPAMSGVTYGANVGASCNIFNNGQTGFSTDATPTTSNAYLTSNGASIVARLTATTFTAPSGTWPVKAVVTSSTDGQTHGGICFDPSGSHYICQLDLNTGSTTNDTVLVADGVVIAEEGVTTLPGETSPVDGVSKDLTMGPSGEWLIHGRDTTISENWVIRGSGSSISQVYKTGDPIFAGATETWANDNTITGGGLTFFAQLADARGNYIIGGTTSNTDTFANTVLVLNNQKVIARENDPVDLDGNGLFDDGVYIRSFNTLANNALQDAVTFVQGGVLAVVTLRDASGALCHTEDTSLGQALIFIPISTCGTADFNCDGDVGTDADIEAFFACLAGNCPAPPCTSNADFNGDGDVGTDADIEAFFRVLAGGNC